MRLPGKAGRDVLREYVPDVRVIIKRQCPLRMAKLQARIAGCAAGGIHSCFGLIRSSKLQVVKWTIYQACLDVPTETARMQIQQRLGAIVGAVWGTAGTWLQILEDVRRIQCVFVVNQADAGAERKLRTNLHSQPERGTQDYDLRFVLLIPVGCLAAQATRRIEIMPVRKQRRFRNKGKSD